MEEELLVSQAAIKSCELELMEYLSVICNSTAKLKNIHYFISAIIKKAIDIMDGIADASKKNNITVQISLMRMLIDCCLATKASNIIGVDRCVALIKRGKKFGDYRNKDDDRKVTDSYLKKEIDIDFPDFEKLYDWACKGVHFSDLALKSLFERVTTDEGVAIHLNVKVGNPELEQAIITNNKTTVTIGKLIKVMIDKYMVKKGDFGDYLEESNYN